VILSEMHVPQELRAYPVRDSYLCDWGFLMPFLGLFQDWLCAVCSWTWLYLQCNPWLFLIPSRLVQNCQIFPG
jgi:hypothetical protein